MVNKIPYVGPAHNLERFNCPHCGAFAHMVWFAPLDTAIKGGAIRAMHNTRISKCTSCDNYSHWVDGEMVYPSTEIEVDEPNEDLPEPVKKDYLEAVNIVSKSPRGAAALLRLAIQKLCDQLVEEKGDLNFKIGKLVENGLNKKIQQALDVVRVVGNNAVHPGQIDLNDNPEVARKLFVLVNMIAQQMITEPAEVDAMFESLPENAKKSVEQRDKK